jgi:feruloyl esterase
LTNWLRLGTGGVALFALSVVAGCAEPRNAGTAPTAPTGSVGCAPLSGTKISPSDIGLPTRGAVVTSATAIPASTASGRLAFPAYCKVLGSILPVDPTAPAINFELDLPAAWNGKALMLGGGGFNGTIPDTTGNFSAGPVDQPVPLARGFAVVASDSGHHAPRSPQSVLAPAMDASFALNAEALRNYEGDALKKTHDVAANLIRKHYAVAKVRKFYFVGGSTGGREALQAVLKWPQDWDGAVSWYPAWNHISLVLQVGRAARALAAPDAWPDQAKRKLLFDAMLSVCDALDGVEDGLVSNVVACNATFDPSTVQFRGMPLRCPGGADLGDQCLADAQLQALHVFDTRIDFTPPLASGETHYPGYNVYLGDLGVARDSPLQPIVTGLALGSRAPQAPLLAGQSPGVSVFWDQWVRFVFAGDEKYDALSLDPVTRGALRERIDEMSRTLDVNSTDFSAFAAKGGKLIIAHGTADVLVRTRATEEYVARIRATMGDEETRKFLRFYEVPGYGHALSTVFNAAWDSLTVLDNWVESDVSPPAQVVMDSVGRPGRTRPLCEYPSWPRYRGTGDVDAASSFFCAGQ